MPGHETPIDLAEALHSTYPELEAAEGVEAPLYLVGGAVRDLLLGRERSDIDLVVVGNPVQAGERLGGTLTGAAWFGRFGTASVEVGGHLLDIATARTEFYPHPGALPEVEMAANIEADLVRRDFTVNAMAVPLAGETELIDPHGGLADLEGRLLRVLHPESFTDDPTRAIRAARYAARLGFELEPETARLLEGTDLGTISRDRRRAELTRLAGEETGIEGLDLLASWGLLELREGGTELARRVTKLLATETWRGEARKAPAVLAAALGPIDEAEQLASERPATPSQAVELAGGRDPEELVLARALGAEWLDRYMDEWRSVSLEIDGTDLLGAGVPGGPALGRGLRTALRRKLDGEIGGREEELAAALEAAREG